MILAVFRSPAQVLFHRLNDIMDPLDILRELCTIEGSSRVAYPPPARSSTPAAPPRDDAADGGAAREKGGTEREAAAARARAAAVDEIVIVGSCDGGVWAFDGGSPNGTVLWTARIGPGGGVRTGGGVASTPALSADHTTAFVGGPDAIWALDVRTGATRWRYETGAMVGSSSALSADGTALFGGCEDGYLYSLSV